MQADRAASPRGRELQARERVHGDRVGLDAMYVAANDLTRFGQEGAHPVAEARKIGTPDRAANGEGDLVPSGCRHRAVDGGGRRKSAVPGKAERMGRGVP